MHRNWKSLNTAIVGMLVAATLLGCSQREPDAEELSRYFKNARVDGKVRMQWPAGQEYANAVLAADADYRKTLEEWLAAYNGEYLWSGDAAEWFNKFDVQARLKTLDEMLSDQAAEKREKALAALQAAIEDVPEGLFDDPQKEQAFIASVWDGLEYHHMDIRHLADEIEPIVRQHKLLYARALDAAKKLGETEQKPRFDEVVAEYFDLQMKLLSLRDDEIELAKAEITDAKAEILALKTVKEALKKEMKTRETTDFDYERLASIEDRIDYQMARRKHYEGQLKQLTKEREQREKAAEASTQPAGQDS